MFVISYAPIKPLFIVRSPYINMATKQINGRINDALTAGSQPTVPRSIMEPCNGGIKAPPTIAITNPAAPRVESSPKPFSAIP